MSKTTIIVSIFSASLMVFASTGAVEAQPSLTRNFDAALIAKSPSLTLSARSTFLDDEGGKHLDLTGIKSAVFLADGTVAALSSMGTSNQLARFDVSGKVLRSWGGRRGSGAGDFREPINLAAVLGDTVFVADRGNNRLNRILMNSGRVEVVRVDTPRFFKHSRIVGVLPGSRLVMTEDWTLPMALPGMPTHTSRSIVVTSPNGATRQIASIKDLRVSQVETRYRQLDTATVVVRLSPQATVILWDTLIVTTSGEPAEISLRNAQGRVVNRMLFTIKRRPITKAMRDADVAQRVAYWEGPQREPPINKKEVQRTETVIPFADSLPVFEKLFASSDGLLWVLEAIAPGDKHWTAIAITRKGTIAGRLRGNSEALPLAFGAGRVLLRSEDVDGVVTLTVRAITGLPGSH